jgi:predicted permease
MTLRPRQLWSRVRGAFGRGPTDHALHEEIETHLSLLAAEFVRRGMSPREARDAARREFGGVDRIKAQYRDQRGLPPLDALAQDARFAFRTLLRDRGFALTALTVLGLGIGVNNMMFTIIYSHTMRGFAVPDPDRVLYISTFDARVADRALSYAELADLRTDARTLQGIAAFISMPVAVGDEGRVPDRFEGTFVSSNAFELLGLSPLRGRAFTPDDDRPGAASVALLGASAWHSRYGGDPSIVGRTIDINGVPASVVGIFPDRSGFPSTGEVWQPLAQARAEAREQRSTRNLRVFGRVQNGVAVTDARAEIEAIVARWSTLYPESSTGLRARVVSLRERFFGRANDPAWMAFITAAFLVLLVSCANVANLLLARSVTRAREIAIRGSLGASRRRVAAQLLIESLVLAVLGAVAGLVVSLAGVQIFSSGIPANTLPYWLHYTIDTRIFAALALVSFGAVLVFGLIPAVQASRTDVNRVLKDGGRRGTTSGRTRRLTTAFLATEIALTTVLLANVVTGLRTTTAPLPSDEVIHTDEVITGSITLPTDKYRTAEQRRQFYEQLDARIRALPGVTGHAIAAVLPVRPAPEHRVEIEGQVAAPGERTPTVPIVAIGPRYFDALSLPIELGREFTERDGREGYEHVIVNRRFVELFFDNRDPVGRRIRLTPPSAAAGAPPPPWVTIVGVAPSIRQSPDVTPDTVAYTPINASTPTTALLLVRSPNQREAVTSSVREQIAAIDPRVPLYRVMTLRRTIDDAEWNLRLSHRLLVSLTLITLAFCIVGLYAVTAHAVSQRTQEFGIRMAVGATPATVRRLVLRRAFTQTAIGLALGIAGALAWGALFVSGSADLRYGSPDTLIMVAAVLTLITVAGSAIPVRRATRLDPVAALRQD